MYTQEQTPQTRVQMPLRGNMTVSFKVDAVKQLLLSLSKESSEELSNYFLRIKESLVLMYDPDQDIVEWDEFRTFFLDMGVIADFFTALEIETKGGDDE
jgi:hypothetical protein